MTTTPADLLTTLIENTPSLDAQVRSLIEPIRVERGHLREHFQATGAITTYEPAPNPYPVGAADGASVTNQTLIGDALSCIALSVTHSPQGIKVADHRHWSTFRGHSSANRTLVSSVMMTYEQALLHALPKDHVKIIDGAHATPLISLAMGLSSRDQHVRDTVTDIALAEHIPDVVADLAADPLVVACPKADSSTDLWDECRTTVNIQGHPLPDKVLASMILDPGEVLTSHRTPPKSWTRLFRTLADIQDPRAKIIGDRVERAVRPLHDERLIVCHAKPHGSPSAIRMEFHPNIGFQEDDVISAVCETVYSPHVREPLTQHLADVFAKGISPLAEVQMERTRMALADMDALDYIQYLTNYRTN